MFILYSRRPRQQYPIKGGRISVSSTVSDRTTSLGDGYDSNPQTDTTCDGSGFNMSSDEGSMQRQRIYSAGGLSSDQESCQMLVSANPPVMSIEERPAAVSIKLLKPPTDSLVAPYNSTALSDGCNLIEQSHVYLLAAPAGGYNSTALDYGQDLAPPFDMKTRLAAGNRNVGLTPDITAPSGVYPSTIVAEGYNTTVYPGQYTDEVTSEVSADVTYHMDLPGQHNPANAKPYQIPVPVNSSEDGSACFDRSVSLWNGLLVLTTLFNLL